MSNQYISRADKEFEQKNYKKAIQLYKLAIAELELIKNRGVIANKKLIHALCGAAVCKAIYEFYHTTKRSFEQLQETEQDVIQSMAKAQVLCHSLKKNKVIQEEFHTKKEDAYEYLRNSFWNFGDDLITKAMQENSDLTFDGRKQLYNTIEITRDKYIQITREMEDLSFARQIDEEACGRSSLAELYDWYSDLFLERSESLKDSDPENSLLALRNALEYNVKAVSTWLKLDNKKDISLLHLGHLNLVHQMFEQGQEQSCLGEITAYINKHLNSELKDTNIEIEVLGMKLYVAKNKIPQEPALTQKLAKQLLAFTQPLNQTQLDYYFNLAKTLVDNECKEVPPISSDATDKVASNKKALATIIRKGKRVVGMDLTNEIKPQCLGYIPNMFGAQKKVVSSKRNKISKPQEVDGLLLLSLAAFQ